MGPPEIRKIELPSKPPLQLELGKRYVRKDSTVTGRLEKSTDKLYPFRCPIVGCFYTSKGHFEIDNLHHPYTIVAEYVDGPPNPERISDVVERLNKTAVTESLNSNLEQIPFEGLDEVGKIFAEGADKYGIDNWKNSPTQEYRTERCRHAIRHLMLWSNGDRSESHLAKVAWFCLTEIYHQKKDQL